MYWGDVDKVRHDLMMSTHLSDCWPILPTVSPVPAIDLAVQGRLLRHHWFSHGYHRFYRHIAHPQICVDKVVL